MSLTPRARLVVLISGRGSNLGAILEARERIGADVVGVISSSARAGGIELARSAGVPVTVVRGIDHATRELTDEATAAAVDAFAPDWVVLAGYMRILGEPFVARFEGRLLNIHPSLLPSFPGLDPHRQALQRGVRLTGCTVHFVVPGDVDGGPIVAQSAVPVMWDDTEASLAARVLEAEHELYPEALRALVGGELVYANGALTRPDTVLRP